VTMHTPQQLLTLVASLLAPRPRARRPDRAPPSSKRTVTSPDPELEGPRTVRLYPPVLPPFLGSRI